MENGKFKIFECGYCKHRWVAKTNKDTDWCQFCKRNYKEFKWKKI